jgi:DNA polymerase-3 subunit beta
MRLTLTQSDLLGAIAQVCKIGHKKTPLPILSTLLISVDADGTLSVTKSDSEMEGVRTTTIGEVEEAGAFCVSADKLLDMVKALSGDIRLDLKDGKLLVRSGRSRFSLATLSPDDYPSRRDLDAARFDLTLPRTDLFALVNSVKVSMANNDVRYYLNGLLLELGKDHALTVVATDGHRLSYNTIAGASVAHGSEPCQVIVPKVGVEALLSMFDKADDIRIRVGDGVIEFSADGLRLSSKLIEGNFPDYHGVIPSGFNAAVMQVDIAALSSALKRAAILSSEKYKGASLQLASDLLTIKAHNPEQEEAEESLDVAYDGDEVEVWMNYVYILDVLASLDGAGETQVRAYIADESSSVLLTGTSGTAKYVIMPMRI